MNMNKRIKKKWSRVERIENKVAQLMAINALLTEAVSRQNSLIEELKNINERNVQATNSRFDYLEKKVADKVSKKSWFSKTLQNWKALVSTNQIQSDEKCGDYAEVTHNGDKAETYVDVYAKVSNRAIKD